MLRSCRVELPGTFGNCWKLTGTDCNTMQHELAFWAGQKSIKSFELNWLPFLNTYRTMCLTPSQDFRRILEEIRGMRLAA